MKTEINGHTISERKILLFLLALGFGIQSWLVYSDPKGNEDVMLSPKALRGKQLWQSNNCQVCHQVYGYGGFLGPDLTNSASHLSPNSLRAILDVSVKQMPRVVLSEEESQELYAWFQELDRTGISQTNHQNQPKEIPWFEYR